MKYSERYDLVMFRDGILIYDTERCEYVNYAHPIEFVRDAKGLIESHEDSLAELAWYRSQQDGYVKGELQDQQAKNQQLK